MFERVEIDGEDFGGRGAGEKIRQKKDQAADERRIGVGPEAAAAVVKLGDEPDLGGAARDAVTGRAVGGGERRTAARAVDDGGEAFLRVVVERDFVEERLLLGAEPHADREDVAQGAKIQAKLAVNRQDTGAR